VAVPWQGAARWRAKRPYLKDAPGSGPPPYAVSIQAFAAAMCRDYSVVVLQQFSNFSLRQLSNAPI